jgi:hypothetical protein
MHHNLPESSPHGNNLEVAAANGMMDQAQPLQTHSEGLEEDDLPIRAENN